MVKTNILKESCPKNVVLMETKKITAFLTFYVWRLITGFVQMGHNLLL